MEINQENINKVLIKHRELTGKDIHINDNDDDSIKREKDIMFGKQIGYENALTHLGILKFREDDLRNE